jgi:hypothetical protein
MVLGESINTTTTAPSVEVQPVDVAEIRDMLTEMQETTAAQDQARQWGTWITLGILLIRLFKK